MTLLKWALICLLISLVAGALGFTGGLSASKNGMRARLPSSPLRRLLQSRSLLCRMLTGAP